MLHLLLALIYLSSAQPLWPLDFADDDTATAVGDDVWLAPGKHSIPVAGDYSDAYIEFTFKSVYPSHNCEYQVWADGDKVYSGSFRNAVATTIPSMLNTFPVATSEITVWTSGCYLNRHALPFRYGANGEALYLVDQRPATVAGAHNDDSTNINYGITFPKSQAQMAEIEQWLFGGSSGMSGTSSFSSQVTEFEPLTEGWFFNSEASTTYVLVDYESVDPYNAAGAEFVIEASAFTKINNVYFAWYSCNASATGGCNTATNLENNYYYLYESETYVSDAEDNRMYSSAATNTREAEAATLKLHNNYFVVDGTLSPDFSQSVAYNINGMAIFTPYVKLWNLNASISDPNHVVVDLRNIDTPAASKGTCIYRTDNPNTTYYAETSFIPGDFLWGVTIPFRDNSWGYSGGFIQCPNDHSGLLNVPVAPCTGLSDVATFNGTVVTNPVTVTIDMAGGAIMRVPIFDGGAKRIINGPCNVGAPNDYYLSQASWFDVLYDSTTVVSGTVGQAFLTNNFAGRASAWGTYQSFFIDTSNTAGADLTFKSKPGYSIDLWPFVFIHGLPLSSGNGSACDASACQNGGVCAHASSSATCTNPATQGGEPVQNEGFANIITQGAWVGTFYGPNNDLPVPFCTADSCWNGGVCVENVAPLRTWKETLYGTGQADNPTSCDCSSVTRESVLGLSDGSSTGPYWGELCQYAPPCDANPCFNGATCVNEGGPVYSCNCSGTSAQYSNKPFTGARCEVDPTTPCDLDPCLNGGTCTNQAGAPGGFTCDCTSSGGWSGHSCGIPPVDSCLLPAAANVCGEFGRCVASFSQTGIASGADYTQCVCLYGYSGLTCATPPAACSVDYEQNGAWQKRDASEVNQRQFNKDYCLNGGSCIGLGDGGATVACLCVDPWVGSRCQWNSTLFTASS